MTLARPGDTVHRLGMTFFLRAVEEAPGRWICKRGRLVLDVHPDLESALAHLHAVADELEGECAIFVHHLDEA